MEWRHIIVEQIANAEQTKMEWKKKISLKRKTKYSKRSIMTTKAIFPETRSLRLAHPPVTGLSVERISSIHFSHSYAWMYLCVFLSMSMKHSSSTELLSKNKC